VEVEVAPPMGAVMESAAAPGAADCLKGRRTIGAEAADEGGEGDTIPTPLLTAVPHLRGTLILLDTAPHVVLPRRTRAVAEEEDTPLTAARLPTGLEGVGQVGDTLWGEGGHLHQDAAGHLPRGMVPLRLRGAREGLHPLTGEAGGADTAMVTAEEVAEGRHLRMGMAVVGEADTPLITTIVVAGARGAGKNTIAGVGAEVNWANKWNLFVRGVLCAYLHMLDLCAV